MGLFSFLRPTQKPTQAEIIPAEDDISTQIRKSNYENSRARKQLELEIMRLEAERTKIQLQAEIEEAKAQIADIRGGDSEESHQSPADLIMMTLLTKAMGGLGDGRNTHQTNPPLPSIPQQPQKTSLSDQEIEQLYSQTPKEILKIGKNMTVEQLQDFINKQIPDLSDESITKIINRVKK